MRKYRPNWRERKCVGCGAGYVFDPAGVPGRALRSAGGPLCADEPACPRCGCVPPAVVATRAWARHALLLVCWLGVGTVFCFVGAQRFGGPGVAITSLGLGCVAVVVCLLHAAIALADPNRHRDRHAARSAHLEELRVVKVVSDPTPDRPAWVPSSVSKSTRPLLVLAALGALAVFAPFVVKAVSGWPDNPHVAPVVVGPSDTVRLRFPEEISAVNGNWKGTPRAELVAEGEARPIPLRATASTDNWGNNISGKSVSNTRTDLWADVTVPDDPALAGKRVEIRVDMTYTHPTQVGQERFQDVTGEASTTQAVVLAARGAGTTLHNAATAAVAGGLVLVGCGLILCLAAFSKANVAARHMAFSVRRG